VTSREPAGVVIVYPARTHMVWFYNRIIIVSDRRPEAKQGIEGKIVRFISGRVRDRVRVRDK